MPAGTIPKITRNILLLITGAFHSLTRHTGTGMHALSRLPTHQEKIANTIYRASFSQTQLQKISKSLVTITEITNHIIAAVTIIFALDAAKLIVCAPWITSLCITVALIGLAINFVNMVILFLNHYEAHCNLHRMQEHHLLAHANSSSNEASIFFNNFTRLFNPSTESQVRQKIDCFMRNHTQHNADAVSLFNATLLHIETFSQDHAHSLAHYMHTVVAKCKIHGQLVGSPPLWLEHIHWLKLSNDPNLLLQRYAKMRQESAKFLDQMNYLLKHPVALNQALTGQSISDQSTQLPSTHLAKHIEIRASLNSLHKAATENIATTIIAKQYKRVRNQRKDHLNHENNTSILPRIGLFSVSSPLHLLKTVCI